MRHTRLARAAAGAAAALVGCVGCAASIVDSAASASVASASVASASVASASVASARHTASAQSSLPLTVTLERQSPWSPTSQSAQKPLTFTLVLHNTTSHNLTGVELRAGRGTTVASTPELTSSVRNSSLPSNLYPVPAHPAGRAVTVPADRSVTVTFRTTTGIDSPYRLCLCTNGVYPIYLSAYSTGSGTLEGWTRTYVSVVDQQSDATGNSFRKLDVAWLWPLVDRPHRGANPRLFTDDDLATEIAPGGRLDASLQVVEQVEGDVPLTLMIDPDLIDELAVMASGHYSYLSAGKTVQGRDGPVAAQWLQRLREVISTGDVSIEFTPYADPDIQSLASAGLTWQPQVPPTMRRRVEGALGGLSVLSSTLSWPPGGAASKSTLDDVTADGSTSVVLDTSDVYPGTVDGSPTSLASLRTAHATVSAALLSAASQTQVADAIGHGTADLAHLPTLLAQLAARADTQDYQPRVAFLSPPRYVYPSPAAAVAVIEATSSSAFSRPVSVASALTGVDSLSPVRAHVRHRATTSAPLPATQLTELEHAADLLPGVYSLLDGRGESSAASALVAQLPRGLQRAGSAGWSTTSTVTSAGAGTTAAVRLRRQVAGLLQGVRIVRPADGHYNYTLASHSSPLPITIENTLPYRAFVRIRIRPVAGLPGLTTRDIGVQSIGADSKQTFRIPASVSRSGRIQLVATLSTGNGHVLGPSVRLSVHSTVFGIVGVVITVAAAAVLLLALLTRYVRRLQRLRRKRASSQPEPVLPEPVA